MYNRTPYPAISDNVYYDDSKIYVKCQDCNSIYEFSSKEIYDELRPSVKAKYIIQVFNINCPVCHRKYTISSNTCSPKYIKSIKEIK